MAISSVRLERIANVAVIIAAVVTVSAWGLFAWSQQQKTVSRPQYAPGDSLENVSEFKALPRVPTLLMVLSTRCSVCTDSMPFYRDLVTKARPDDPAVQIVVVSREPLKMMKRYLASQGLHAPTVIEAGGSSMFRVTRTPTLIIMDPSRQVIQAWLGQLSPTNQNQVTRYVSSKALVP